MDSEKTKVFTFGLGTGCDVNLCEGMAKAGRGSCSIVKDGKNNDLNGQVIKALQQAMEPSLKNCTIEWGGQTEEHNANDTQNLNEVFRN